MKTIFYLSSVFVLMGLFFSCQEENEKQTEEAKETIVEYAFFGDTIHPDHALNREEMLEKYTDMKEGDTIPAKFAGAIENVCQKKGCWMHVDLGQEETVFVRFKDYGFFMPLNATGSEAILEGKAFISVVSVDERKHYAEDEGLAQEEIDAIDEPEITYGFLAHGVLIKE